MRTLIAVVAAIGVMAALTGCGAPNTPVPSPERRVWRGPGELVASSGIVTVERREIAQKVAFPACIEIDGAPFRYERVRNEPTGAPVPTGLFDTGYGFDRWRLLARAGALTEQNDVYVTVRGSTGITGRYLRLPAGERC